MEYECKNCTVKFKTVSPVLSFKQSFYPTWIIFLLENLHFRLQALVFPLHQVLSLAGF